MFALLPILTRSRERSIPQQGSLQFGSGISPIVPCETEFHYWASFESYTHLEVAVGIEDLALQEPLLDGSREMRAIQSIVASVADTDAIVLIRGESGVGKEVIARSIHAASD